MKGLSIKNDVDHMTKWWRNNLLNAFEEKNKVVELRNDQQIRTQQGFGITKFKIFLIDFSSFSSFSAILRLTSILLNLINIIIKPILILKVLASTTLADHGIDKNKLLRLLLL